MPIARHLTPLLVLALIGFSAPATAGMETDRIEFAYEVPKDPVLVEIHADMRERRVLERLKEFLSPFRLPEPLRFTFRGCDGEDDAYHFDNDITVCYELVEELRYAKPEEIPDGRIDPYDVVAGPFFSTVLHEFAHAFFFMHETPLLGREEDAADYLAAYIILLQEAELANALIRGTAYAYNRESEERDFDLIEVLASEHGTAEQRYYNVLCLAYGADPKGFADLVQQNILPEERAEACQDEFEQIEDAYKALIQPHVDQSMAEKVWRKLEFRDN